MQRFANILFVASPGVDDAAAFERALQLAQAHRAGLTVLDIQPEAAAPAASGFAGVSRDTLARAAAAASSETLETYRACAAGRLEPATRTRYGVGFVEIIREVLTGAHDLVVKAAHDPALGARRLFGSLDMHLLRKCPVPVWLEKPGPATEAPRPVLAAVDVDVNDPVTGATDSLNRRILTAAAGQALAAGEALHVAHAWQPAHEGLLRSRGMFASEAEAQRYVEAEHEAHRAALEHLIAHIPDWTGAQTAVRPHLRQGLPDAIIPTLASELGAGLVVMGTVARTGIAGLLIGNTAESIIDGLDTSLLAIKPPGFRTPVQG